MVEKNEKEKAKSHIVNGENAKINMDSTAVSS